MSARLKVYGITLIVRECPPAANGNRQARVVVAATSQRAAARAFGTTLGHVRDYGGETGNAEEVAAAVARPGVPLWRKLDDYTGPFRELRP